MGSLFIVNKYCLLCSGSKTLILLNRLTHCWSDSAFFGLYLRIYREASKHCQSVPSPYIATCRFNHLSSINLFVVFFLWQEVTVYPHTCQFQLPVHVLKCVSAGAKTQHGIHGPVFLLEPPPVLRFSNATGSQVSCSAHGSPPPDVTWLHHDGSVVTAVPGFRWVRVHIILTFRNLASHI